MSACSAENCESPATHKAWVRGVVGWTPIRVFLCSYHAGSIKDAQLVAPPFPMQESESK